MKYSKKMIVQSALSLALIGSFVYFAILDNATSPILFYGPILLLVSGIIIGFMTLRTAALVHSGLLVPDEVDDSYTSGEDDNQVIKKEVGDEEIPETVQLRGSQSRSVKGSSMLLIAVAATILVIASSLIILFENAKDPAVLPPSLSAFLWRMLPFMIVPFFVLLVARLMFWGVSGKKQPKRRKGKLSHH